MLATATTPEFKPSIAAKTNTSASNWIEKIITIARSNFLDKELKNTSESKDSCSVTIKEVGPFIKICRIEYEGKVYKIFGIEKSHQSEIDPAF